MEEAVQEVVKEVARAVRNQTLKLLFERIRISMMSKVAHGGRGFILIKEFLGLWQRRGYLFMKPDSLV